MQVKGRSLNDIFAIKYFPLPFVVGPRHKMGLIINSNEESAQIYCTWLKIKCSVCQMAPGVTFDLAHYSSQ